MVYTLKKLTKVPDFLKNYKAQLIGSGYKLEVYLDNNQNEVVNIITLIKKNNINFTEFDVKKDL